MAGGDTRSQRTRRSCDFNRAEDAHDGAAPHAARPGQSHLYCRAMNKILADAGFDRHAETVCARIYARKMGRPSLPPGVYFWCLLLGFFEGIDSDRGIAWRAADSLSLRDFLGIPASKPTPDHSTLSKARKRIAIEEPSGLQL
jgi:transposase